MTKDEKPSLRLPINELEAMTPHQLSEIVANVILLLRRIPNVPMNRLVQAVQALSDDPQLAQNEPYSPTVSDEALFVTLVTVQVVQAIQQEYANGNITDLAAYNRLYDVARRADVQAHKLLSRLEKNGVES
jgi:hypothetical protein